MNQPVFRLKDLEAAPAGHPASGPWTVPEAAPVLLTDLEKLETLLLSYLDKLYFEGRTTAHGEKLFAGLWSLNRIGAKAPRRLSPEW